LNDEATKAGFGRRSVLLAGTALPVLSVATCDLQLQQAQGQPSSTPATAGNAVAVAPPDTIATIQAKLNSVPVGGRLVFLGNSAFNFNGQTVTGKSGITVYADGPVTINGGPGPGSAGAFNFGGMSNWTLRGKAPGQGFTFNGTLINADGTTNGAIGCCAFSGSQSNGDGNDGSVIRTNGATGLLVINNDVANCHGAMFGGSNWDNNVFDGNHVTAGLGQAFSIQQGTDPSRGRNIIIRRNIFSNWGRGVIETGGTVDGTNDSPGQVFTGLIIDINWFTIYGNSPTATWDVAPISVVARQQSGTKVTNNYFLRGNNNPSAWTEAIEINSSVGPCTTTGNLIVNVASPFPTYGSAGQNVHGNSVFNVSQPIPAGNTTLAARPADPPPPVRIAW
jgi:hypothetical protein